MLRLERIVALTPSGFITDFACLPIRGLFADTSPTALVRAKKDTKALSRAAAFALAGFEFYETSEECWDRGLFVSAPAPAVGDKAGYDQVLRAGEDLLQNLGGQLDQVRPVSGLIGLPNGVMCFAARITGALGPNSVAVNEGVGCHQALATALRHYRNGMITNCLVAGYAEPNEVTNQALYQSMTRDIGHNNYTDSVVVSEWREDGGCQIGLLDAFLFKQPGDILQRLQQQCIALDDIGLIFESQLSAWCNAELDQWVKDAFRNAQRLQSRSVWGYQAEASGLVEFGILQAMLEDNQFPSTLFGGDPSSLSMIMRNPIFLVFAESVYGQRSCVIGKVDSNA